MLYLFKFHIYDKANSSESIVFYSKNGEKDKCWDVCYYPLKDKYCIINYYGKKSLF